jgi:hypothetical protein
MFLIDMEASIELFKKVNISAILILLFHSTIMAEFC